MLKTAFPAARDVKAQQKSGEKVTSAHPSSVVHSVSRALVVSIRSAFFTESAVVKLLGVMGVSQN